MRLFAIATCFAGFAVAATAAQLRSNIRVCVRADIAPFSTQP